MLKVLEWAADNPIGRPTLGISRQIRQGFMVSDIKGLNPQQANGTQQSSAGKLDAELRAGAVPRVSKPRDDTVELSGLSEVIKTTAKALATEPGVDETRVEELKSAVARGDYQIDPDRIARKLIDSDSL
jgi:negative regulator of flagellin synthesis FlgM